MARLIVPIFLGEGKETKMIGYATDGNREINNNQIGKRSVGNWTVFSIRLHAWRLEIAG